MLRFPLALFACFALPAAALAQGVSSEIVPAPLAQRYGLRRAWLTRAEVDPSRGRVAEVTLYGDVLYVQTNQAAIQAIDAETGRKLWVQHVGKPGYPAMSPAAGEEFVTSCVGSTLYVLRRSDGNLVWERRLENGPSAGVAMGADRLYVPLVNNAVVSYSLRPIRQQEEREGAGGKRTASPPGYERTLAFRAAAMSYSPPLVHDNTLAWGTADGYVYVAAADSMQPRFRFSTRGPVNAPLAIWQDRIIAASRDGYVYCMQNLRGSLRWQFSAGTPIEHQPVVTGDTVYVIPESGHMYALEVRKGRVLWSIMQIAQFLAASQDRVYVLDFASRIVCLDAASGSRLFAMPVPRMSLALVNTQTDRIYLGSRTGILQCLHEQARAEPLRHTPAPAGAAPVTDQQPTDQPAQGSAEDASDDAMDDEQGSGDDEEGDADEGAGDENPDADA
jgi:outer membrane protein assembly factor BamB